MVWNLPASMVQGMIPFSKGRLEQNHIPDAHLFQLLVSRWKNPLLAPPSEAGSMNRRRILTFRTLLPCPHLHLGFVLCRIHIQPVHLKLMLLLMGAAPRAAAEAAFLMHPAPSRSKFLLLSTCC